MTAPRASPANARRRPSAAHGKSSKPKKFTHSNDPDRGKKPHNAKSGAASNAPSAPAPRARA